MEFSNDLIANRLEELVEAKGLTINRLSKLAGISQSSLSSISTQKSTNPGINTLARIASGLDMSLTELLDFPPYNQLPDGTKATKERDKWQRLGDVLTPDEKERVRKALTEDK